MQISNSEIIELYKGLNDIINSYSFRARACFALVKSKNRLKPIIENLEETRKSILENLADKDDKGAPIIVNGSYSVSDKAKLSDELSELFNAKEDIELEKVFIDDISDVVISGKHAEILSRFVD